MVFRNVDLTAFLISTKKFFQKNQKSVDELTFPRYNEVTI